MPPFVGAPSARRSLLPQLSWPAHAGHPGERESSRCTMSSVGASTQQPFETNWVAVAGHDTFLPEFVQGALALRGIERAWGIWAGSQEMGKQCGGELACGFALQAQDRGKLLADHGITERQQRNEQHN